MVESIRPRLQSHPVSSAITILQLSQRNHPALTLPVARSISGVGRSLPSHEQGEIADVLGQLLEVPLDVLKTILQLLRCRGCRGVGVEILKKAIVANQTTESLGIASRRHAELALQVAAEVFVISKRRRAIAHHRVASHDFSMGVLEKRILNKDSARDTNYVWPIMLAFRLGQKRFEEDEKTATVALTMGLAPFIESPAQKVSTIDPFHCDKFIRDIRETRLALSSGNRVVENIDVNPDPFAPLV